MLLDKQEGGEGADSKGGTVIYVNDNDRFICMGDILEDDTGKA